MVSTYFFLRVGPELLGSSLLGFPFSFLLTGFGLKKQDEDERKKASNRDSSSGDRVEQR